MPQSKRTRNFKNKGAYERWLAYDKMHIDMGEPSAHPLNIEIGGKPHKVNHGGGRCANGCGRAVIHYHDSNGCCGHCCGAILASESMNGTGFEMPALNIGFENPDFAGIGFDSGL